VDLQTATHSCGNDLTEEALRRRCWLQQQPDFNGGQGRGELAIGFPACNGRLPDECATVLQILQDGGSSTFWVGKSLGVGKMDIAAGAGKSAWPLQKGPGFLGGETNQ
jgi:hypothetical protein